MKELINHLGEMYPNVKFAEGNENGNKVLLYDNRDLMWDEKFENVVLELADKYLSEDEYESFAYIYDFLDEIGSDINIQSESEFQVVKRIQIKDYRFTLEKRIEECVEQEANVDFTKNSIFLAPVLFSN